MKVHVDKDREHLKEDLKAVIQSQAGKSSLSNVELLKRIEAIEKLLTS